MPFCKCETCLVLLASFVTARQFFVSGLRLMRGGVSYGRRASSFLRLSWALSSSYLPPSVLACVRLHCAGCQPALKFRCQCFLCGCKATRLLKRELTSAMLRGRHINLAPRPSKTQLGDINDCQSLTVYSPNKENAANNKGVCNGFVNGVNCWIRSTYMCVRSVFFMES